MPLPPTRLVNQFANPSFENGETGWTFTNASVVALPHVGSFAAKISTATAGLVSQTINSAQLRVVKYYWSLWVKHLAGTTGQLNLSFTSSDAHVAQSVFLKRNATNVVVEYYPSGGTVPGATITSPTGQWQSIGLNFDGYSATTNLTLEAKRQSAGSDWLLDDAAFLVPDYTIYVDPPPDTVVMPAPEPSYVRQGHPPGRGRVYTDDVLGSCHREGQVGRDRYGRLRRLDDLDDPARDDFLAPTSREVEEPAP